MQNVIIIGNITKDIYLRMDNRKNQFEADQNNVKWLDFAFNGSSHEYFSRVSIFGGASISLEVLSRFGIESSISNAPAAFLDGQFVAKDSATVVRQAKNRLQRGRLPTNHRAGSTLTAPPIFQAI